MPDAKWTGFHAALWIGAALVSGALLLVALTALPSMAQKKPATAAAPSAELVRRERMAGVKSWGYQLRLIDPDTVSSSPFDLVVVDHGISANRRFVREYTPLEVERMKTRPDGSRRILLAYLSIGEAERYRFYWNQEWYEPSKAPAWLSTANERWDGNWRVRFWDPGWHEHIFKGADNYLARIKAQGFDGIYLDRVDVYHELLAERPGARADMVRFVAELAAAGRSDRPGFLVVMQNAEELLGDKTIRAAIDAVAKEDLYFGAVREGEPNPADMVQGSLDPLVSYRRSGRPVFVVEYLFDHVRARSVRQKAKAAGFILHIAERSLGSLVLAGPDEVIDTLDAGLPAR